MRAKTLRAQKCVKVARQPTTRNQTLQHFASMDENPYSSPQAWCYDASQAQHDEWSDREPRGLLHHEFDPTGMLFNDAARRSGLVVDGLRFVFDAMAWAPDLLCRSPESHIRGQELCLAIVRYAQEIYEQEGIEALRDWGIVTGEDVGRIVSAMVLHGLMEASQDDKPDDFKGVGLLRRFVP
jgi:uncharacterized repeat protein (TIGR04138 family)